MTIYIIYDNNQDVVLNSGTENSVFIYGNQDLVTTNGSNGTALQTVHDHGSTLGLVMQYANHFDVYGFQHDLNGLVQLMVPEHMPLPHVRPDGNGGSWLGHEHFINDPPSELKMQHLVVMHEVGNVQ